MDGGSAEIVSLHGCNLIRATRDYMEVGGRVTQDAKTEERISAKQHFAVP